MVGEEVGGARAPEKRDTRSVEILGALIICHTSAGLWHWGRWGQPSPYASSRKALSSLVDLPGPPHSAFASPVSSWSVGVGQGGGGGSPLPFFTSAKEMNCLQESSSTAHNFALRANS